MGRLEIEGGKPFAGEVSISGAKNEALKVIPLAILINNSFSVENVPEIADVVSQLKLFERIGGKYELKDNLLRLDGSGINSANLDGEISKKLRASIVYLGPLLAKFKEVEFPFPGGCAIGSRPIETHLKAFSDFGALVTSQKGSFKVTFNGFSNKNIEFAERSVTATENILLFLSYFSDEFTISNCAIEPEILALIEILNTAGAQITKINEREFKVKGNPDLKLENAKMIPDRIEAFSYLIGFVVTGGEGTIDNFPSQYMEEPLKVLKEIGVKFDVSENKIKVFKSPEIKPFEIKTAPYPGFPTDMQSPMSLVATLASGKSKIVEAMFENRLGYIGELVKMGLRAEVISAHEVIITGPNKLEGSDIEALDLRSGITLVLAALASRGKSIISQGEIIDRGYEKLTQKLAALGAEIRRYD